MQRLGLDPLIASALLPVLDLASWEKTSACVNAMACRTARFGGWQYETVLQGFLALLVFQGTLAIRESAYPYMLQMSAAVATQLVDLCPPSDQQSHCYKLSMCVA